MAIRAISFMGGFFMSGKFFGKFDKRPKLSKDDEKIMDMLFKVKKELDYVRQEFDYTTDDILIDSFIYEIQALNKKYQYYIKLCKEKGLVADGFEGI